MSRFEAKLTSKGQITLPAKMRNELHVDAGDRLVFTQADDGSYRISALNDSLGGLKGIVRSGSRVTGRQISDWIESARGRAAPEIRPHRRTSQK